MSDNSSVYNYLWSRLPLILMFVNSYIIYRILVITKLTDVFVLWSIQKSRGRISLLLLYIMLSAALLSFFIPNAVTILILLPVLKNIDQDISLHFKEENTLTTALTLSVIYGANIGGMGSLIGSPANLILIGALDFYKVPGCEQINFFNWFIWSLPMVILFIASAFGLLITFSVPKEMRGKRQEKIELLQPSFNRLSLHQRSAGILFMIFLVFWILEAILKEIFQSFKMIDAQVCIAFFLIFLRIVFAKFLHLKDMIAGFPKRGILFLCLLVGIILIIQLFKIDKQAGNFILSVFQNTSEKGSDFSGVFFIITLLVIFITEILSNTVVATIFFPIAYFISDAYGISPLALMISVSCALTCAFMTPIATPCNALAFGEMKGTSFRTMFISGFLLNIIGASLMTVWLPFIIPFVY